MDYEITAEQNLEIDKAAALFISMSINDPTYPTTLHSFEKQIQSTVDEIGVQDSVFEENWVQFCDQMCMISPEWTELVRGLPMDYVYNIMVAWMKRTLYRLQITPR